MEKIKDKLKKQEADNVILLKKTSEPEDGMKITGDVLKGFCKKESKPLNPCLFIKFYDLNNQIEKDAFDCNPRQSAVLVGLKLSF